MASMHQGATTTKLQYIVFEIIMNFYSVPFRVTRKTRNYYLKVINHFRKTLYDGSKRMLAIIKLVTFSYKNYDLPIRSPILEYF